MECSDCTYFDLSYATREYVCSLGRPLGVVCGSFCECEDPMGLRYDERGEYEQQIDRHSYRI